MCCDSDANHDIPFTFYTFQKFFCLWVIFYDLIFPYSLKEIILSFWVTGIPCPIHYCLPDHIISDLYIFSYNVLWNKNSFLGGAQRRRCGFLGHVYSWSEEEEVDWESRREMKESKRMPHTREMDVSKNENSSNNRGKDETFRGKKGTWNRGGKQGRQITHQRGGMRIRCIYKPWKPTARCFLGRLV